MLEKIKNNKLLIFCLIIIVLLVITIIILLNSAVSKEDYDNLQNKFSKQKNYNERINEITSNIKTISENATLYVCEEEKTLYIEQRNYDTTISQEMQSEIIKIIKEEVDDTFENYEKLILISYLNSEDKVNVQIVREVYDLSTFIREEETEYYIRFEEYEDMYNSLIDMYELYN